jgi:hypothetical protein
VSRLNAWLRALGATGVLGLGVLLFCVPFYFSALRPLEGELQAQRLAAERLKARSPLQPVAAGNRADELRRFYNLFPGFDALPDELERLRDLARESNLDLLQGEYRLEKRGDGLAAYRITLPVRGTYVQVRGFLGAALKSMPTASVDALSFERKKVAESQLEAQLRLTLYFRPHGEDDAR